eukprot:gene25944-34543_t
MSKQSNSHGHGHHKANNGNDSEIESKYKFGRTLGHGTFATVRLATRLSDGADFAVKIVKRSSLSREDENALKMEIQILQSTAHHHIISIKEVFYCRNFVYMVMDLMTGGELFDRIVMKDHYSEREAKDALHQIVIAIQYCHSRNIVHRDLKPENILYATPDQDAVLKLADFGLANILKPNELMHLACGTPGYVAPEVLRGQFYGKEVDMWSIGVILYILLCGFPPFYDDNNKKLFSLIIGGKFTFPDPYWSNVSDLAKDLVRKLLVVDAKVRFSAEQVLSHPWMQDGGQATSHLEHFAPNMKSFNARRRFRCAIHAVQLVRFLSHVKAAANEDGDLGDLGDHGYNNHEHTKEVLKGQHNPHPNGTPGKPNSQNNNTNTTPEELYQSTILTKVVQTSANKLPVEVVDHILN